PRAAAFENRLKCCVAWGACYEFGPLAEMIAAGRTKKDLTGAHQLMLIFGTDTVEEAVAIGKKMTLKGILDRITCPLLVVHAENDRMTPDWHAERTLEEAVNSPNRTMKTFTREDGGVEHCQADNNRLGVEYIADWVAEVLGGDPKGV
ncbi:MAG: dipeptidyl aminopeptidase, partial [Deltaproteobacteria bacterium]|nr:dipeptidyl aminopeptidase [Deltaproteobacteria bacterium]